MDQWWTILRTAIDPGAAAGHFGGMGGDICFASVRAVISGELRRRNDRERLPLALAVTAADRWPGPRFSKCILQVKRVDNDEQNNRERSCQKYTDGSQ